MTRSIRSILAAILLGGLPGAALAQGNGCNPPPAGLDINTWFTLCQAEINYAYQYYNQGLQWQSFVPAMYRLYVIASSGGGGGQSTACAPDGQTYCNSSGWQMTCTNGQWLTGAVQC